MTNFCFIRCCLESSANNKSDGDKIKIFLPFKVLVLGTEQVDFFQLLGEKITFGLLQPQSLNYYRKYMTNNRKQGTETLTVLE